MSLPKSVRLNAGLEHRVEDYLQKNTSLQFSTLINLAVEQFISQKQVIELIPVDAETFLNVGKRAFKNHKDAMDKLK